MHSGVAIISLPTFFFFEGYGDHRDLHSFPTRRSSDLQPAARWSTPRRRTGPGTRSGSSAGWRSEEHTSELQSRVDIVCRLPLEKKKPNSSPSYMLSIVTDKVPLSPVSTDT